MGFFDHLHKGNKTAIKQKVAIVRKEVVGSTTATRPTAPKLLSNDKTIALQRKGTPQATHNKKALNAKSPQPTPETAGLLTNKNARKRPRAAEMRLESSSDENDDDNDLFARKRVKTSTLPPREDTSRNLLADSAMTDDENLVYVHGAQIASIVGGTKYEPKFKDLSHNFEVHLEYPGSPQRERFELLRPLERDEFDPVEDILQTTALVPAHYLPEGPAETFLDDANGYHRRMKRAVAQGVGQDFKDALDDYNKTLAVLRSNGTISGHLAKLHHIPLEWVERILNQTYARTVSLKVNSLKKYENGTDNVYGELLPRFVSKILHETNLKSDQLFVDLGSGVGNVVLQAALEVGCESWGCEMMDNACDLAELQEQEFKARCCLWGLNPGKVHLERGDFLKNIPTGKVLQKADVVLVNNQAFTPNLNNELMNLFLDLKEGCQIVSLKSFVPHDHKITSRNFNSPVNLLNVTEKYYFSNCVSWTSAPGTYYVAIKDRRRLREFEKRFS